MEVGVSGQPRHNAKCHYKVDSVNSHETECVITQPLQTVGLSAVVPLLTLSSVTLYSVP